MENEIDYDKLELEPTSDVNVYRDKPTGQFYFSDEAYQLSGPYVTFECALIALNEYCRVYLGVKL